MGDCPFSSDISISFRLAQLSASAGFLWRLFSRWLLVSPSRKPSFLPTSGCRASFSSFLGSRDGLVSSSQVSSVQGESLLPFLFFLLWMSESGMVFLLFSIKSGALLLPAQKCGARPLFLLRSWGVACSHWVLFFLPIRYFS